MKIVPPTELCFLKDGALQIVIPLENLRFAAEHHPGLDETADERVPTLKIIDLETLAKDVVLAINAEAEDGSTPLIRMFDAAIVEAVESGTEGIDPDYDQNEFFDSLQ
jgi:hypothetical protein